MQAVPTDPISVSCSPCIAAVLTHPCQPPRFAQHPTDLHSWPCHECDNQPAATKKNKTTHTPQRPLLHSSNTQSETNNVSTTAAEAPAHIVTSCHTGPAARHRGGRLLLPQHSGGFPAILLAHGWEACTLPLPPQAADAASPFSVCGGCGAGPHVLAAGQSAACPTA